MGGLGGFGLADRAFLPVLGVILLIPRVCVDPGGGNVGLGGDHIPAHRAVAPLRFAVGGTGGVHCLVGDSGVGGVAVLTGVVGDGTVGVGAIVPVVGLVFLPRLGPGVLAV